MRNENIYNKFKQRPTEPVLTNYGKTKEIDAYVERLAHFKTQHPDHIIFRNKNLNTDIKKELQKIDEGKASRTFYQDPKEQGITFTTMSPYTPSKKRDPPPNFSTVSVRR